MLQAQHGNKWAAEDQDIDEKLAAFEEQNCTLNCKARLPAETPTYWL